MSECYCCQKEQVMTEERICPECGHVFQGIGWEGIDAHWRAKHEDALSYEEFWNNMCGLHRWSVWHKESKQ